MDETPQLQHWQHLYARQDPTQLSWFQPVPDVSLELLEHAKVQPGEAIIDVGGGGSVLVDALLARNFEDLTVLDWSSQGIQVSRDRLGLKADFVDWICEDVTSFIPERRYSVWHDRAVFHFLLDEVERALYAAVLDETLAPGGIAIVATFAPDGPDRCSGLATRRYDGTSLLAELGPTFRLERMKTEVHRTPGGAEQRFCWSLLRKL